MAFPKKRKFDEMSHGMGTIGTHAGQTDICDMTAFIPDENRGYLPFCNQVPSDPDYGEIREYMNKNGTKYFGSEEVATNVHFQFITDWDEKQKTNYDKFTIRYYKGAGKIPGFNRKTRKIDRTPRYALCYCVKGRHQGDVPARWWTNVEEFNSIEFVTKAHHEYYDKWHKTADVIDGRAPKGCKPTVKQLLINYFDAEGYHPVDYTPETGERLEPSADLLLRTTLKFYGSDPRKHGYNIWRHTLQDLHLRYRVETHLKLRKSFDLTTNLFS